MSTRSALSARRRRAPRQAAVLALLTSLVAALLGVLASPATAASAPMVGVGSGRCLDVTGNTDSPGTPLEIWDCNDQGNQSFEPTAAGELRTLDGTRCVDTDNKRSVTGTKLVIQPCDGTASQKWQLNTDGSLTGTQSGYCADVYGAGTANGTGVVLWYCNSQTNQRWTTTATPTSPPGGTCTATPVDPQATTQARNLLCYLYSQYGQHIVSGQQETNGSENEIDYIHTNTGKYPAIRGMDMCDRPGSITRAAAWWNAGGIPLLRWHVGAPATGYCNYGGTASITNTLTPGTAEYTSYTGELDQAAAALLDLQAQDVAVIWAPYHEAGGTWFWWSKEGADPYKKLFAFQFDYLTKTKGVHNLVWMMPYNGDPQASFYPGKGYTDIGGADTYVSDRGPLTSLFNATKSIVGPTVPIALHENSAVPDPAQLQSSRTPWVLFNTWNGSFITGQDPTYLNTVYNSAYVVTRDEVPDLK
ncbi:glycosyl hydrolase [Kitasatospora phosalacinea]|uniref:glycosyl hydrolase n=1 Tax=Kitasatospora phosalacinea TaxID=2065 RepID=UPI000B080CE2|nr:glycosyl hydrolase [Kitasatospora phosalacinea]